MSAPILTQPLAAFTRLTLLLISCTCWTLHGGVPSEKNPSPAPVVIAPTVSPWEVTFNAYGWMAGVDTDLVVRGFEASSSFGIDDILRNLNMVAMFNLEVRRGRWGGWVDGLYLDVSAGADGPGSLFDSVDVSIQNVIAEAAVFYRVWEGQRGLLDIYGGARYMRLSTDLTLDVNDTALREVSQDLSARVFDELRAALREGTAPKRQAASSKVAAQAQTKLAAVVSAAEDKVESKLNDLRRIAEAHPRLVKILKNSDRLRAAIEEAAAARSEQIIAEAEAKAAQASSAAAAARQKLGAARARAQRAISNAEKKLAKAIERELRGAIPEEISGTADWVDPFVGLRARYQLTEQLYAIVKSDIGGFGVGSELSWQAYGGLSYQFTRSIAAELGYRHLTVDYSGSKDLSADLELSGIMLSLLIHF